LGNWSEKKIDKRFCNFSGTVFINVFTITATGLSMGNINQITKAVSAIQPSQNNFVS